MAKQLRVTGLVQGVGYRASFARQAQALDLRGWVRNRRDGSVEAMIDGDAAHIAAMIEWARRGPPAARVKDVLVTDSMEDVAERFDILPDA
jgi:acylphosphatase